MFRKCCVRKDVYSMPKLRNSRLAFSFCNWIGNYPLENHLLRYDTLTTFHAEGHSVTSATAHSIACKLLHKPLAIRKQRFRKMRSCVKQRLIRRTCARQENVQSLAGAFLAAMTYIIFHIDARHPIISEIISYEQATESYPTDVLLEYQQCQMECNHDLCSDSDDVQDTVPVADPRLSFSRCGARGSIAKSLLLPSDSEQMLRVCLSTPQPTDITRTHSFVWQGLREEATFIPCCAF